MAVVVLDVLTDHRLKMTPVEDQYPIETLPTDGTDESS
jgi:hypothetical protein